MPRGAVAGTGRFLTVAEVADQMRVSTMTVYRLIKAGELGAVRVGKSYRIARGRHRPLPGQPVHRGGLTARRPAVTRCRYDTISFLSDYGTADEFVGVVKSVIRQLAPDVAVIDVTHEVPRLRRAGRRPRPGPQRPVPRPGRRAGGRRPRASAPTGGRSRSRWATASRCWSARTTGCWRRRWPWSAAPPGRSS